MSNHKANHSWIPRAVRLYNQGMSVRQVANKLGQPQGTVYYHMRQRGVRFRQPGVHHGRRRAYDTAWVNYAEELYRQGMTLAEVAKLVDRNPGTVWLQLSRRQVPMHPRGPRRASWPEEARRMWRRGYSLGEISAALDKPRDQVRFRLRQVGILVGRTPEWVSVAIGLHARGYTANEIAAEVGCQAQTVRRQLRLAGVWNNPRGEAA
jgi:hypothetical protein